MISYFFSRKVEDQLVTGSDGLSLFYLDCPIRMFSVQIAVLIDHLRLNPDSELYAQTIDFIN